MAVRRVLFCRQHNGKFRTLARLRNHFDIAALPCYDLAGQIQANAHALLFVYFFLTIEAPEDGGLIAFGNALAGVEMCIRDRLRTVGATYRQIKAVIHNERKQLSWKYILGGLLLGLSLIHI